jgi:hypothetical protein
MKKPIEYVAAVDMSADMIDVRDIIARVEHLEQLEQPGPVDLGEDNETAQDDLFAELRSLRAILEDLKGNGGDEEWRDHWYPVTLIREDYFEDYARELASDIGALSGPEMRWPHNHIDWKAAAEELTQDYTSCTIEGNDYYYR